MIKNGRGSESPKAGGVGLIIRTNLLLLKPENLGGKKAYSYTVISKLKASTSYFMKSLVSNLFLNQVKYCRL